MLKRGVPRYFSIGCLAGCIVKKSFRLYVESGSTVEAIVFLIFKKEIPAVFFFFFFAKEGLLKL